MGIYIGWWKPTAILDDSDVKTVNFRGNRVVAVAGLRIGGLAAAEKPSRFLPTLTEALDQDSLEHTRQRPSCNET
jgi:hypothetical protein